MGSVGKQTISSRPDLFNGLLGARTDGDVIDILTRLNKENAINPNYNPAVRDKYHVNCALCATAVVLNTMGYDVEAMPRDEKWRGFDSVFEPDYSNPDNYLLSGAKRAYHAAYPKVYEKISGTKYFNVRNSETNELKQYLNPDVASRSASKTASMIEDKVQKWGNGGIGALSVSWANSSNAHEVNVFNQSGKAYVYDAQTNNVYGLKDYLTRTIGGKSMIRPIETEMVRLDNAKIKKNINPDDLNKMVRRKKR